MSWARTILSAYRWTGAVAYPFIGTYVAWRAAKGKEDNSRRRERYGISARRRPPGPLVWMHAASVGETNAVVPLIERILESDINVVLTTGTVTSAKVAEARLGAASSINTCRSTSSPRSAISSTTGCRTSPSSPNPRSGR